MIYFTHTYGTTYLHLFQPCGRFPDDLSKTCRVSTFFVTQILYLSGINMMTKQQIRSGCYRWDALYIICRDYTYCQVNSLCPNPHVLILLVSLGEGWTSRNHWWSWLWLYDSGLLCISISSLSQTSPTWVCQPILQEVNPTGQFAVEGWPS